MCWTGCWRWLDPGRTAYTRRPGAPPEILNRRNRKYRETLFKPNRTSYRVIRGSVISYLIA
jgi:hypothetical protein